jgi:hypothetical protein
LLYVIARRALDRDVSEEVKGESGGSTTVGVISLVLQW